MPGWTAPAAEVAGWTGSALILIAYALVSAGRLAARSVPNQLLNFAGGAALAVNAYVHSAWPVLALEGAWCLVAGGTLVWLWTRPAAA